MRLEEDARYGVRFGLMAYKYKPPRSRRQHEWDHHHVSIAERVVRQLVMSGWEVSAGVLRKKEMSG
jgi:hypothetical protein